MAPGNGDPRHLSGRRLGFDPRKVRLVLALEVLEGGQERLGLPARQPALLEPRDQRTLVDDVPRPPVDVPFDHLQLALPAIHRSNID